MHVLSIIRKLLIWLTENNYAKKLQFLGVPTSFAKTIFNLLADFKFRVRANDSVSPPFESFNGVPQGDPLSPLLFSIFTSDIPSFLRHTGVPLGNTKIKYLLYADDLVILASSACELQFAISCVQQYAEKYHLTVNCSKTKCMIFYKGSCPRYTFKFKGHDIETCIYFTYLGVVFTTRLSVTKHVDHIISKCNSKIGFLFGKLPIKDMPLNVVIDLFNTYVLPITTYALPIWYPNISAGSVKKIDSLYTKFLKRYLGLPYSTNNSIVHFLTHTSPLHTVLNCRCQSSALRITYPLTLNGFRVNIPIDDFVPYNPIPSIPPYFWLSQPLYRQLPIRQEPRRALLYDVIDLIHCHLCKTSCFHLEPVEETCLCRFCDSIATHYHHRECPHLKNLSPSALLKKAFISKPQ